MRKVTLIGRIALAGTATLTLAAMSSSAEARARGFRLRFGIGPAAARTPASVPARPAATDVPILLPVATPHTVSAASPQPELRVSQAEGGEAPPMAGTTAPEKAKPAPPPVRVAGPWCAPDRIVGAGVGFCQVN